MTLYLLIALIFLAIFLSNKEDDLDSSYAVAVTVSCVGVALVWPVFLLSISAFWLTSRLEELDERELQ